jgi:hypothetical protein
MRWPYRASLCKLKLSLAGELLADVEKKNAELTAQLAESVGFMRQRAWKNEAALAALASTANAQNPLRVRG